MTSYQNRQLNRTRYIYKHLGHDRRMLVCIYLHASICTVTLVHTQWLPFAGSLAQLCTKLYENCKKVLLLILYASLNAPIPVYKPVCSFTCIQALVLIYLYASPDTPIFVCNPGAPIPVCKSWRSYTCLQAQMLLYPYISLHAPIHVYRLICPILVCNL